MERRLFRSDSALRSDAHAARQEIYGKILCCVQTSKVCETWLGGFHHYTLACFLTHASTLPQVAPPPPPGAYALAGAP